MQYVGPDLPQYRYMWAACRHEGTRPACAPGRFSPVAHSTLDHGVHNRYGTGTFALQPANAKNRTGPRRSTDGSWLQYIPCRAGQPAFLRWNRRWLQVGSLEFVLKWKELKLLYDYSSTCLHQTLHDSPCSSTATRNERFRYHCVHLWISWPCFLLRGGCR